MEGAVVPVMRLPTDAIVGGSRTVALFLVALSAACSLCSEAPVSEVMSTSGRRAAVLVRDCGATTDFATVVQVGGFFRTDVLVVVGQEKLLTRWSPDGAVLTVRVPKNVPDKNVFVKAFKARGVSVLVERE